MSKFMQEAMKAVQQVREETDKGLETLGYKAVSVAKATGDYQDHTGRLRRSNYFRVENGVLTVGNNAPYASHVEARGRVVLSGAEAFLRDKLSRQ